MSKTDQKTTASNIRERVAQKKADYAGIARVIQLFNQKLPIAIAMEISNEQFRLEHKLLELEEAGWDAKIASSQKVLKLLKTK